MENIKSENISDWVNLLTQNRGNDCNINCNEVYESFLGILQEQVASIKSDIPRTISKIFSDDKVQRLAERIPVMLKQINVSIRAFDNTCRSCIISDSEVDQVVTFLFDDLFSLNEVDILNENEEIPSTRNFLRETFYALAYTFRQVGYEMYKPSEQLYVNDKLAEKIARAIHARYSKLMIDFTQNAESKKIYNDLYIVDDKNQQYFSMGFDQLPDAIKSSNIDNAYHIPTKLLSIGYGIKECKNDEDIPLLLLSEQDIETMAMVEHVRWAWEKRLNGFRYAPVRDDNQKMHHCLIPYDDLPEVEKEKDRVLVRLIPTLLCDIGYAPVALNPEQISSINYPQRAQAKIHHVKHNSEKLFKEVSELFKGKGIELPQAIVESFQNLINDSKDVGSGFTSAGTIQRTFLPSPLYFRECLPDSFLLYKPKDIVSGDFFFISKKDDSIIYITADCTGHGIQGAMLSAICYNYIDQAVNQNGITDPAMIIANVIPRVEYIMRRSEGNIENKSGMELAVCRVYTNIRNIQYAGLNRPMYYYSNNQLNELEPYKYRENFESIALQMKTQSITLNHNDTVYTFSDGFPDQFGGEDESISERFKTKRVKQLLSRIQDQSMTSQRETINQTLEQWRQQANQEQTDDIIVIGVRL